MYSSSPTARSHVKPYQMGLKTLIMKAYDYCDFSSNAILVAWRQSSSTRRDTRNYYNFGVGASTSLKPQARARPIRAQARARPIRAQARARPIRAQARARPIRAQARAQANQKPAVRHSPTSELRPELGSIHQSELRPELGQSELRPELGQSETSSS